MSANDAEDLIVRAKSAQDSAVPAGNGTMVGVLARLFYLTGRGEYRDRAEALVAAFSGEVERNFHSLCTLIGNNELVRGAVQIVVVGDRGDADDGRLLGALHRICLPNRVLQVIAPGAALPQGHPARGKGQHDRKTTAYVCRGPVCSLPITDPEELRHALSG